MRPPVRRRPTGVGGPLAPAVALVAATIMVAAACTGGGPASPSGPPAASFTTKWPIKHVIFIVKENRSFDFMFGRFPGANGATTGLRSGSQITASRTAQETDTKATRFVVPRVRGRARRA